MRISRIRNLFSKLKYELTHHALLELNRDGFTVEDLKSAVNNGRIVKTQKHGHGIKKYVVKGKTKNGRLLQFFCRRTTTGRLRIITVFETQS